MVQPVQQYCGDAKGVWVQHDTLERFMAQLVKRPKEYVVIELPLADAECHVLEQAGAEELSGLEQLAKELRAVVAALRRGRRKVRRGRRFAPAHELVHGLVCSDAHQAIGHVVRLGGELEVQKGQAAVGRGIDAAWSLDRFCRTMAGAPICWDIGGTCWQKEAWGPEKS